MTDLFYGDKIIVSENDKKPFKATFIGFKGDIVLFEVEHSELGKIKGAVEKELVIKISDEEVFDC